MRSKIHRVFEDERWRNVVLITATALYSYAVVRVAEIAWPGRTPAILLALPIMAAALRKPPQFVIAVAAVVIVVDVLDIVAEHPPLTLGVVTLLALVAVGFLGTWISLERHKAIAQRRRHEAMILAVESLRQPLTIIVGYAHLLRSRGELSEASKRSLVRICDAASELNR